MLVLFESSAGYALLKVKDEGKLSSDANIAEEFSTPEKASNLYLWIVLFVVVPPSYRLIPLAWSSSPSKSSRTPLRYAFLHDSHPLGFSRCLCPCRWFLGWQPQKVLEEERRQGQLEGRARRRRQQVGRSHQERIEHPVRQQQCHPPAHERHS